LAVVRTKHLPGADGPNQYSSITQIRSGEIPEDINYYLLESEQRQGALAAGVFVSTSGGQAVADNAGAAPVQVNFGAGDAAPAPVSGGLRVEAAGGWIVQLLPFAAEESIALLEANLAALQGRSPTSLVRDGLDGRGVVELLLNGLEPQFTPDKPVKSIAESCPCSEERVMRTMALIPRDELEHILEENEVIEAKCEFCGTLYRATPGEVRERLAAS
jgi:molecular chaperone Hsp33